jgi:hypothetical protein
MIVVVIIGIILAFILSAAMDGLRRSEERATQALISKLETGLVDRIDALTSTRGDVNFAHVYMAALWNKAVPPPVAGWPMGDISSPQRAQVIAQFDRVKAELPDVFATFKELGLPLDPNYLFNFQAFPYPGTTSPSFPPGATYAGYLLPLGIVIVDNPAQPSFGGNTLDPVTGVFPFPESTGIFGASYGAAGGLLKQLGARPQGYDGADNPIGGSANGLIDELAEGGLSLNSPSVVQFLGFHTHKTARAEVLYALLVNGQGPLGSVFDPDDFSDREVKDTDGDGLLEFVDAWGEPLQFFRWPIFYFGPGSLYEGTPSPDVQRGFLRYPNVSAKRELNTLDPNNLLVNPAWWSSAAFNTGGLPTYPPVNGLPAAAAPLSAGAGNFHFFFHSLLDPSMNPNASMSLFSTQSANFWDRGGTPRRAYYSRPLILSGGPDKTPGVARIDGQYFDAISSYSSQFSILGQNFSSKIPAFDVLHLLYESQAASFTPNRSADMYQTPLGDPNTDPVNDAITRAIQDAGADDITNHNLQAPGGAIQ